MCVITHHLSTLVSNTMQAFSKSILLLQVAICVVYSLIVPVDDGDPPPVSPGN